MPDVTASGVIDRACSMRTGEDSFDVAIEGWTQLVAAGRFAEAERVADMTFRKWSEYSERNPEWAAGYAGAPPG